MREGAKHSTEFLLEMIISFFVEEFCVCVFNLGCILFVCFFLLNLSVIHLLICFFELENFLGSGIWFDAD